MEERSRPPSPREGGGVAAHERKPYQTLSEPPQLTPVVHLVERPPDLALDEKSQRRVAEVAPPKAFDGPPLSFETYRDMSPEEHGAHFQEIERRNKGRIAAALKALGAIWIKVVEGKVVAASHMLGFQPADEDIWEEGERQGTVPYVFVAPQV